MMSKNVYFASLFFFAMGLASCSRQEEVQFQSANLEPYRPVYHFTPKSGWMNDPNGMVYLDGTYHLFFQHYPDSTVWGPMHWGHAMTNDLTDWEELPIALFPDSLGYIFSGSAVWDAGNSSLLGTDSNPPLVALYTYHDMEGERSGKTDYQSQAVAFSLDKGKTWEKYQGNPVLPNQGIKDFRDPKVLQWVNTEGKKEWIMTLAVMDRIQFYGSENLLNWTLKSEFGQGMGAHGGVWECPDLLPFTLADGTQKWVLLVSINPGGPQKGSATQYFIGQFENGVFTPDDTLIRWLDYGPDNYAGVTWSNLPKDQNRTLFIGWMSNWLYGQAVPTEGWRSSMTIPRELSLFEVNGTLLLKSTPAEELTNLRKRSYQIGSKENGLPSEAFEITASVSDSENFNLFLSNEKGDSLRIFKEGNLLSLDRSKSGITDFHEDFGSVFSAPMSWEATSIRIFVDAHAVEVFVNEGELVLTSLVFPRSPWKKVHLLNGISKATVYDLKK
ncbi:glycoside hydrolase family 32 protein [Algoriphagus confluentis]|uniref:Glycoside hydrolase family 32 protein n=1 Tax=Algoriphagus confluentis TaxID=1697556 RepID=A0ABQ6PKU6_9BACT|nr:glycoside hydrolase family 32 protein [Algoriphagus confluentis]